MANAQESVELQELVDARREAQDETTPEKRQGAANDQGSRQSRPSPHSAKDAAKREERLEKIFQLVKIRNSKQPFEEEQLPYFNTNDWLNVRIGDRLPIKKTGQEYDKRYRVIAKLGYGRASTVWLCADTDKNRYVACKIYARNYPQAKREVAVLRHLRTIDSEHVGQKHVRGYYEQFSIGGRSVPNRPVDMFRSEAKSKCAHKSTCKHKLTCNHESGCDCNSPCRYQTMFEYHETEQAFKARRRQERQEEVEKIKEQERRKQRQIKGKTREDPPNADEAGRIRIPVWKRNLSSGQSSDPGRSSSTDLPSRRQSSGATLVAPSECTCTNDARDASPTLKNQSRHSTRNNNQDCESTHEESGSQAQLQAFHVCITHKPLGLTLEHYLYAWNGRLPLTECKAILRQVLHATDFLHTDAEVVHGSIDASNIMTPVSKAEVKAFVDEALQTCKTTETSRERLGINGIPHTKRQRLGSLDGGFDPILCDFGAAREFADLSASSYKSFSTCAPEVISGKLCSEKVDIWAIGLLAWEMIAGTALFDATDPSDLNSNAMKSTLSQMVSLMDYMPSGYLDQARAANGLFDGPGSLKKAHRKILFRSGEEKSRWKKLLEMPKPKRRSDSFEELLSKSRRQNPSKKWGGTEKELLPGVKMDTTEAAQFVSFMGQCMTWDPERRLSARELLEHPWLRETE